MTREEALRRLKELKDGLCPSNFFQTIDEETIELCEALMQPCECEALRAQMNLLAKYLAVVRNEDDNGYFYPKEVADKCMCLHLVPQREDEEEPWCDAEQDGRAQCWLEWARQKANSAKPGEAV